MLEKQEDANDERTNVVDGRSNSFFIDDAVNFAGFWHVGNWAEQGTNSKLFSPLQMMITARVL